MHTASVSDKKLSKIFGHIFVPAGIGPPRPFGAPYEYGTVNVTVTVGHGPAPPWRVNETADVYCSW